MGEWVEKWLLFALSANETVTENNSPVRRNVLGQRRSFWAVIENYERESTELFESVSNVRALPGVK